MLRCSMDSEKLNGPEVWSGLLYRVGSAVLCAQADYRLVIGPLWTVVIVTNASQLKGPLVPCPSTAKNTETQWVPHLSPLFAAHGPSHHKVTYYIAEPETQKSLKNCDCLQVSLTGVLLTLWERQVIPGGPHHLLV